MWRLPSQLRQSVLQLIRTQSTTTCTSSATRTPLTPLQFLHHSHQHLPSCPLRYASSAASSSTSSSPSSSSTTNNKFKRKTATEDLDILPIVQLRVSDELMQEVTDEILIQAGKRPKSKSKASSTATTKLSAKSSTSESSSKSVTSASSAKSSSKPSSPAEPKPLDSEGWQVWEDIEKPFASPEEEAEFKKWQKILEEEEKIVDRELEEEFGSDEQIEEVEAAKDEMVEVDEDETNELEVEEEDNEEKIESESPPSTAASSKPKARSRRSELGVREGRVRTRMVNSGGEQVMEITGVDEDEEGEFDEDDEGEDDEEWADDLDMTKTNQSRLDAKDPELLVGRGVGGVFFTRKELTELNEKDLVETYTKGSGKGGQKVNKTNSCVQLLHLPTGTRVKCQYSRELQANRSRARTIMKARLEELLLGSESRTQQKAAKERKRKDRNRRRHHAKKKLSESESEEPESSNPSESPTKKDS